MRISRKIEPTTKSHTFDHAFASRELLAIIAAVTILLLLMVAWHGRGRGESDRLGCIHRLNHIGRSFQLWAADHNGSFPMKYYAGDPGAAESDVGTNYFLYFQVLSNQLRASDVVWCPADRKRRYPTNFTADFRGDRISYFVGLDADSTRPTAFLCGDRNISTGTGPASGILNASANRAHWTSEIHHGKGNVALENGSVVQLNKRELKKALESSGIATNRLAMP